MIIRILNFFFGCHHLHTTWPQFDLNKGAYVVCIECGNEMLYRNYELPL